MPVRPLSFPKTKRLVRTAEFALVRQTGDVQRGLFLMLGVKLESGVPGFRAGFVTSKRIGSAVVRNRVRRRLRAIVRKHQDELRNEIWVVTIARSAAARASYQALEDEWLRLAKRASILAPL